MKKVLKIAVFIQLLILYCFAIYPHQVENNRLTGGDNQFNLHSSKSTTAFDSSKLYSHAFQTDFLTSNSSNLPTDVSKHPVKDFFIGHIDCKQLHLNVVLKYLFHSVTSSIRFKQNDIIFPFHYFW